MQNEKQKRVRISEVCIAVVTLVMAILALFLINNVKLLSGFILILNVAIILIDFRQFKDKNIYSIAEKSVIGVIALLDLVWLISSVYGLYCVAMILEILSATYLTGKNIVLTIKRTSDKKVLKTIGTLTASIVLVIGFIVGVFLSAVAVNPNVIISPLQKTYNAINTYDRNRETETVDFKNGNGEVIGTYTNDLAYTANLNGKQLENSYFDVYKTNKTANPETAPTYFYIHGGGYVWGDKIGGDPNTKDSGLEWYIGRFLEQGYNVVSPNYVFAPDYLYPTSLLQLNECVKYCMDNASSLGINMDKVVFGGGSAGGNLAGMLALIYTNPTATENLNTTAYLPAENVKACVFVSALINNEEFGITHSPVMDWLFLQCGRSAFDCGFLQGNDIAHKTNITAWVDGNYCPSYISDGNSGTFYSQAEALHARLNELGVKNQLTLYPKSTEVLAHGFESTKDSPCAQDNMNKVLAFLAEIV